MQVKFISEENQSTRRIIEKTIKTIVNDELRNNVKAILLFGSFADNSFTSRSDIDICVLFKKELSLRDATAFRIRTSGQLSEKVGIQVFSILPQKIKKDIARNHKVLYRKTG